MKHDITEPLKNEMLALLAQELETPGGEVFDDAQTWTIEEVDYDEDDKITLIVEAEDGERLEVRVRVSAVVMRRLKKGTNDDG